MRIAYLCSDAGVPIGGQKGASVHVAEMTRAMVELGHEVRIFARRAADSSTSPALPDGVSLFVPEDDPIDVALEGWLRADPEAGRAEAWTVAAISGASSFRHQTRDAIHRFAPDLIYERYSLFGATGASLAGELARPFVLEVNAPLSDEQAAHRGLAFRHASRSMEQHILRAADRVVAVSGALATWLESQGVAQRRIVVLANGVDPERFDTCQVTEAQRSATKLRLGLGARPVVGFVGTLKPWHDVAALLHAVALLREEGMDPTLLIVGEGPQRSELESLAGERGLSESTVFTGAIPHAGVVEMLSIMDVAAAPYRAQENFYFSPLKLFEYLAAGRPVVAASIGDIDHCTATDTGGWTYAPGDVVDLAAGLRAALSSPSERARRAELGRRHVRAQHTWRLVAERALALEHDGDAQRPDASLDRVALR